MITASQAMPTSTDTGQFLPTGFDPGNGSAKLIVNGIEIRIPSLIAPLHGDIYEVPLVRTGSLISYRSGTRTDLIGQRWFAGSSAYTYSPNGHQKVVDDRKGKNQVRLAIAFRRDWCIAPPQFLEIGLDAEYSRCPSLR